MANMKINYCGGDIYDGDISLPTDLVYNGSTLRRIENNDTFTMNTKGKSMATNVTVGGKTLNTISKFMRDNLAFTITSGGPQYTMLEYITGDKAAGAITDICVNDIKWIESDFLPTGNSSGSLVGSPFGGNPSWGYSPHMYYTYVYINGSNYNGTIKMDFNVRNTLTLWYDDDLGISHCQIAYPHESGRTTKTGQYTQAYISRPQALFSIFGCNRYGSMADRKYGGNCYYIKTKANYDDTTYNHEFLPAKRNSDNAIGFLDTVTNQFWTSIDIAHPFIAGPEKP